MPPLARNSRMQMRLCINVSNAYEALMTTGSSTSLPSSNDKSGATAYSSFLSSRVPRTSVMQPKALTAAIVRIRSRPARFRGKLAASDTSSIKSLSVLSSVDSMFAMVSGEGSDGATVPRQLVAQFRRFGTRYRRPARKKCGGRTTATTTDGRRRRDDGMNGARNGAPDPFRRALLV